MGSKNEYFKKINELLEATDYPTEIKEISELEDFLNDVDNQQYDEYDEIESLYDQLMDGEEELDDE